MKYRVMIVDDHKIFRDGFKLVLNTLDNVQFVGEAATGKEFLELLRTTKADVVFMDINLPVMDGIAATQEALKLQPDLKIIAISSYDGIEYVNKMLYAGVEGYLLKDSEYDEIKDAIESVMTGRNYFSKKILVLLTKNTITRKQEEKEKTNLPRLTKRELEIVGLMCKGFNKKEIAERLYISERTVEKHKENLMMKTGTNNSVSLVVFALRNKFAEVG
jgi:DNA-binding NarL/FixJ family response regulator